MDVDKRGRGRGRGSRGNRGRGRGGGRGRGRGKKVAAAAVVYSEEETSLDQSFDGNSNAALEENEVVIPAACNATSLTPGGADAGEDVIQDVNKENVTESSPIVVETSNEINPQVALDETKTKAGNNEQQHNANAIQQATIDMEADISQLEAPTFTTISRGPPEPMLRLKWNHKVNLIGEKVLNPMIHNCDQCGKPILVYGRMIPCKHVFCLKCARAEPIKTCPRCNDKVVRVEQSGLGTVFMCTHGGSRYGNTGCRRTYLSQRDLQAHINHRHVTQPPPPQQVAPVPIQCNNEIKTEVPLDVHKSNTSSQRKLSESAASTTIQAPSTLLTQRSRTGSNINNMAGSGTGSGSGSNSGSGNSNTPTQGSHSALTQANLARINNANAQECHQGKVALHHTLKKTPITQAHNQPPETVADASYYSSVLNSFGSSVGGNNNSNNNPANNSNSAAAVGYGFESPSQPKQTSQTYQYYR